MIKYASLALCFTMTGCIYLPTPHKEWITPPASGRVVSTDSRAPITNAVITRYEPVVAQRETRTTSDGGFTVPGVRELRWLHLDRGAYGKFRVEAPGYTPVELSRGGWAFSKDLHLDFGEVLLRSQ